MPSTLRTQVALAFGALVLATAAALSFGLAALYGRLALNEQGDDIHALARSTAIVLADGLRDRMREVELLAGALPADYRAWKPTLEKLRHGRAHYEWVGAIDASGKVLAATGDRASAEAVRFFDFSAPIYDRNGEAEAVLRVYVKREWLREVINSLRSTQARDRGILVFVLDRTGAVIHGADVGEDVRPADPAALGSGESVVTRWSDGERYLTAAARLPVRDAATDMGWTIVTRQPIELARAAANESRRLFLMIGVAAALLAVFVAWWLAGRFSKPLVQIADAARRVERGELAAEIPQNNVSEELGQLAVALQRMKASLIERDQALIDARDQLEERVNERTAELTTAQRKLEEANEFLAQLALRDALTGLYNRLAADERLTAEWARQRRTGAAFSVLLMDIDHFKKVNDTFGHAGGDEVLQAVAVALRRTCRASDLCARFGGEEFIVLMPDTRLDGALRAAEKIRRAVAALESMPTPVTVSVGVSSTEQGFPDSAALVAAADEALYRAKREGRNRVIAYAKEAATT